MPKVETVTIKDPNHPSGEIVVNADDHRAVASSKIKQEAPKPKGRRKSSED